MACNNNVKVVDCTWWARRLLRYSRPNQKKALAASRRFSSKKLKRRVIFPVRNRPYVRKHERWGWEGRRKWT